MVFSKAWLLFARLNGLIKEHPLMHIFVLTASGALWPECTIRRIFYLPLWGIEMFVENTHLPAIIMFHVLRIRSITWAQVQHWLDWLTAAFLLKVSFTLWISWSFSLSRDSRTRFWLKMLLCILNFTMAVFLLTCAKMQLCTCVGRQY